MTIALLTATDVKVHFGGVKAVDGVTVDLDQGRLYGMVGPNGSGKSTLLGAFTRLTRLTSGTLAFNGDEYQSKTAPAVARMGIGRTFQTVRLLPALNVLQNVMLGADCGTFGQSITANWLMPWHTRRCEAAARERALDALERVGLADLKSRLPNTLSYGTQRRVEIARALASKPLLVLFDEPTAGMNRKEREEIAKLMMSLRDAGLTQMLVEHDVPMVTSICDHLLVMDRGRLIASGLPGEVVRLSAVREAYMGKQATDG